MHYTCSPRENGSYNCCKHNSNKHKRAQVSQSIPGARGLLRPEMVTEAVDKADTSWGMS